MWRMSGRNILAGGAAGIPGPYVELAGMVSLGVQEVSNPLLFPSPYLRPTGRFGSPLFQSLVRDTRLPVALSAPIIAG